MVSSLLVSFFVVSVPSAGGLDGGAID